MIIHGDCLEVMKSYPDNHFTNILTDPPYGLSFMGKAWDHSVPGVQYWQEALRICKPGAIMLCFGGTRTYHRLTCAIEDAGWQIRDCLMWIYGSGFPKSHNHFGFKGYGTALKPAYEPIIMAMKPLDGTFAQNAEKWGVAGVNIDSCRIESIYKVSKTNTGISSKKGEWDSPWKHDSEKVKLQQERCKVAIEKSVRLGRWPANTLFDEQAAEMLGDPARFFYCAKASSAERNRGCEGLPLRQTKGGGGLNNTEDDVCGKYGSIKAEQKNHHPTVKPIALLEYLLKLIAPPQNALILDPFVGSGSTCLAAKNLGLECRGIEISEEYCEIARKRYE